jgi:RNA polymerase sigma-70 factor (ECF subfamily)
VTTSGNAGHGPPDESEAWWVLRAQAGSRADLERLVVMLQDLLRPRLLSVLGEPANADDVLQDVLFAVCRKLGTLNDPRLFRPWAHRLAMRAAWRAAIRSRRDRERSADVDPDTLGVAGEPPDDIGDLLAHTSPASRLVLVMHYVDGHSLGDIAQVLGVSIGTVKSRLAYGLRHLRKSAGG